MKAILRAWISFKMSLGLVLDTFVQSSQCVWPNLQLKEVLANT